MIGAKRVVAIIPARAGSKGVPNKNLRPLGGKPLVAWPIQVALNTPEIDRVIVSTDGPIISNFARSFGVDVHDRPAHLAADDSLPIDLLHHLVPTLKVEGKPADYVVYLEPTSPFRRPEDIRACLELLEKGYDSAATFMEAHLNPHRAWKIEEDQVEPFIPGAVPWLPRQSLPKAYQLNGAVYAFVVDRFSPDVRTVLFGRIGAVLMGAERSIDIDTIADFKIAEALLSHGLIAEP